MAYKDVDLIDLIPNLSAELRKDAKGSLPIDVWLWYFWQHSGKYKPVLEWCINPDNITRARIDPQRTVDEAQWLVSSVIMHLMSDRPTAALEAARKASVLLIRGSSLFRRRKGQPRSMQHQAVRAYIIRKFNPHPKKPGESTVSWAKLADMLFINDGKCPRKIHDEHGTRICGLTRHQYDSLCVKALTAEVMRLHAAMKHEGIPV
jgi:hypothetical protein